MPNWGITQFAIARIGAIAVPVLPAFSSIEIQNILEHSESKIIFVSKLLYKLVADIKTSYLEQKILMNTFAPDSGRLSGRSDRQTGEQYRSG